MTDTTHTEDESTETKAYGGYLIVNWRDDDVRYRKTEPEGELAPQELAIPLTVEVEIPDIQVPEIHAEIQVPPAKVEQAVTGGAMMDDDDESEP